MKRNNFLKALVGLPFIAPLIGKGEKKPYKIEDNPLWRMRSSEKMTIIKGTTYCYLYDEPKEPHVWKEEDIQIGLYIKSRSGISQIVRIEKMWGLHIPNTGHVASYYTKFSIDTFIEMLNYWKFQPATKAEVIEMIMNSDKNFI
jgi:hypothetical protein